MTRSRRGFSLIELLIVISVIAILAAIVVPKLNASLMLARENAAMQEVGALHKAIAQYYAQFSRYPKSLDELGPQAANLIPKSLASGRKGGYVFTLVWTAGGYEIGAVPESFGGTGKRTFYSDQNMTIHHSESGEMATAGSPEI